MKSKKSLGALTAAMVDKAVGNGKAEPPVYWEWPIVTQYDLETIGGTD